MKFVAKIRQNLVFAAFFAEFFCLYPKNLLILHSLNATIQLKH